MSALIRVPEWLKTCRVRPRPEAHDSELSRDQGRKRRSKSYVKGLVERLGEDLFQPKG